VSKVARPTNQKFFMTPSRPEPPSDRRGAPRTAFTPGGRCLLVAPPDYRCRPAVIRDVSRSGVGLVLAASLPVGAALAIRPEGPAWPDRVTALRVRHATPLADGRWLIGCAHATDLTPAQMSVLRDALEAGG
jgi:hypothetical protein